MKRIWTAFFILALMAALAFGSHAAVHRVSESTLHSLQEARTLVQDGDFEKVQQTLSETLEEFDRSGHLLELFFKREYVANIRVSLAGLNAYANEESAPDLCSEIDKAAQQVRMMEHMYESIL